MQAHEAKALLELIVEYANEKDALELRDAYQPDGRDESGLDAIARRFAGASSAAQGAQEAP
ncbi:hypothetical protein [Curtobacterium sp. Arg-1]|uniref:hypothetical protein n=1 Tax=Curtobacterium sp. Arg-1 TaxID=2935040 RepID=UPI0021DA7136|nr:hypothetical protein [Curtobacterium sp. Arg-1]UXZ57107.1 hypothetical protein MXD64_14015 [Curtobacterium sp. Arg-1]